LQDEISTDLLIRFIAILKGDKSVHSLACKLIIDTNDSGFCYGIWEMSALSKISSGRFQLTVLDQSSLDFGS